MKLLDISKLALGAMIVLFAAPVQAQQGECEPAPELCNDLDDDCDGRVDEDFNLDEPCFDGVGACQRPGFWKCFEGRRACKTPPLGEPGVEVCNDRDDDCDHLIDEGQICGGCEPDPEVCDGLDNDCDLRVDEGFNVGGPCMRGVGECAVEGELECGEDGEAVCNAPNPGQPGEELCNGLDDDCDGRVDEGYDVGGNCVEGEGACQDTGKWVCTDDGARDCDADPGQPLPERCNKRDDDCDGAADEDIICGCEPVFELCNELDDDCDGEIDEGLDQGEPCSAGVGECRNPGEIVCRGGEFVCSAEPRNPGAEICNALDDDCDGRVDEGFPVGDMCAAGVGQCARAGHFICRDGEAVCDAEPAPPGAELCNGLDDDCDDKVDEEFPVGDDCRDGQGACAAEGQIECEDGAAVCNAEPGQPQAELCNGADDDCDGRIDEGFGLGGMCGVGVGLCGNEGRIVCRDGEPVCDAEPLQPRPEVCNRQDDDCDGSTDEGVLNDCGDCGAPPIEVCNDRDDDCDGQTDEGCGPRCVFNDGICMDMCPDGLQCDENCFECEVPPPAECERDGNRCEDRCPEGLQCDETCTSCEMVPCLQKGDFCIDLCPQGTVCDQDCGECVAPCQQSGDMCIANCPEGQVCDQDCGACVEPCVGNQEVCSDNCPRGSTCDQNCRECVPEIPCSNENGQCVDNCPMGQVCDEQCEGCRPAPPCAVNPLGLCEDNCPAGWACDQDCGGCVETCADVNGECRDNCPDGLVCDGQCAGCVPACVRRGDLCVDACPDGFVCDNDCQGCVEEDGCSPLPEACDGLDNDCDGAVDEGFGLGEACRAGLGACAADGIVICGLDGAAVCSAQPGDGVAERCDQMDNDCDGAIDEGIGNACTVGVGACQGGGRLECQPDGALVCTAQPGDPRPESCNGADDDCDGTTDEGFNVGGPCAQGGACDGQGVLVCGADGGTTCDVLVGDAGPERCDGGDNDCDGAVDERPECCAPGEIRDCGVPVGVCRAGMQVCQPNFVWGECDGTLDQRPELCDQSDNDCDGAVDENFQALGEPCVYGAGQCARDGIFVCDADGSGVICSGGLGLPAEVCDEVDQDCDGIVDEGVTNACGNCDVDCIGDRLDNDCDGRIDERAVGEDPVPCGGGDPGGGNGDDGPAGFKSARSTEDNGGCAQSDAPTPLWLLAFLLPAVRRRRR